MEKTALMNLIFLIHFSVQQWTSDDLINSYKVSCKKHNTKPINSILNQLQVHFNILNIE